MRDDCARPRAWLRRSRCAPARAVARRPTTCWTSYRLARANDPVLAAADAARRHARELADQARAALLPQVVGRLRLQRDPRARQRRRATDRRARSTTARHARRSARSCSMRPGLADGGHARPGRRAGRDVSRPREQDCACASPTAYFGAARPPTRSPPRWPTRTRSPAGRAVEQRYRKAGLDAQVDVDQSRSYQARRAATRSRRGRRWSTRWPRSPRSPAARRRR